MVRTGRTSGMWGAALVIVMAMAGCSGGGGGSSDKAAAPSTSAAPIGPTTTVRPVPTSFTGQNSAQFCALARTYNDRFTSVGANPTPAQLRTGAREGQTAIGQAVSAAPAEIKKDVQTLADGFGALLAELEKVNFEATKLSASAVAGLAAPEFIAATTRFQAYTRSICGVG